MCAQIHVSHTCRLDVHGNPSPHTTDSSATGMHLFPFPGLGLCSSYKGVYIWVSSEEPWDKNSSARDLLGGVIWKIPLWKWSREAETVRNVVNPQWWLWSTGTQLPWGVLGETVEPENYLWIISPQRGGRWNLYPKSTPFLSWLWLMEKEKCQLPYWRVQRAGAGHSQAKKRAHPSSRKRLQCQLSSSLFDPWKNSFLLSEPQFPSAVTWLPTRLVWGFWHWQPSAWPPKRDGFSVSPPELLVPFQPLLVRVAQGLLSGSPSSLGHSLWVILSNLQTLNSI